jgi:hypothetical protein
MVDGALSHGGLTRHYEGAATTWSRPAQLRIGLGKPLGSVGQRELVRRRHAIYSGAIGFPQGLWITAPRCALELRAGAGRIVLHHVVA